MLSKEERDELFNNNTGLAYDCAFKHWSFKACDPEDIKQEALIALWKATEGYKSSRAAFSTYAVKCINTHLTTYGRFELFGHEGVRMEFNTAVRRVQESMNTDKSLDYICDEHDDTQAIRDYAHMLSNNVFCKVSLETPLELQGNATTISLVDCIEDPYNLEEVVYNKIHDEAVIKFLDKHFAQESLKRSTGDSKRVQKLLDYYYDYLFGCATPYKDIAKELGISMQAVSNKFLRWNRKLRYLLRATIFRDKFQDMPKYLQTEYNLTSLDD